jgi:hypothetical protein
LASEKPLVVSAAIVGHGIFGFCLAFDAIFGGSLAVHLMMRSKVSHKPDAPDRRTAWFKR